MTARRSARPISRRTAARALAGLAGAAALLGAVGCASGSYQGARRELAIAAGEPGGFYLTFADMFAARVNAVEPQLHAVAVPTQGSLANLELLRGGEVDLALVLTDVAKLARQDAALVGGAVPLAALGRVYQNYTQLVVPADHRAEELADLRGGTLSLGAPGAGVTVVGERLLRVAGLTEDALTVRRLPLAAAGEQLRAGGIDGLLWSGGIPTPALDRIAERQRVRLLPLAALLPRLRALHGAVYEEVSVPAGTYGLPGETPTVGVANLLVCSPSLPDDVADAIVRVLVSEAARLLPPEALGTQYLDLRSLIGTQVPLHPGAVAAYRRLHG
ncbi:TAXI family TRAP transporter solute-binding subunit [Allonocardiopsis opalescens]|uniref:TRAP transporter TAXI family solute receptor n=1 Tax=Allonocardiopsis opalescens TaxID=1144618 RepID=A0A2T0PTZ6_9ACTN|nr:TAXI family TRAP transporter solute-binding subunit [Allonocardiopsis opalescens]PRX92372.1 hypothetical protein CLV72_110132 [Allonocardiopsis opalescens]